MSASMQYQSMEVTVMPISRWMLIIYRITIDIIYIYIYMDVFWGDMYMHVYVLGGDLYNCSVHQWGPRQGARTHGLYKAAHRGVTAGLHGFKYSDGTSEWPRCESEWWVACEHRNIQIWGTTSLHRYQQVRHLQNIYFMKCRKILLLCIKQCRL